MVVGHRESRRVNGFEVIFCVFIVLKLSSGDVMPPKKSWNYNDNDDLQGPRMWRMNYPTCGGRSQSPVMINKSSVIYDPCLRALDFSDYSLALCLQLKMENHGGHTAEVIVSGGAIYLKGGNLSGMYRLKQLHFHWGRSIHRGSEHSINGEYFPMEVHFVHVLLDCTGTPVIPKKLAVVGFLIRVGAHNEKYEQLLRHFDKIRYPGNKTRIQTFPMSDLLPVSRRYDYYRYQGSLTTPPCSEIVTWSVGIEKICMSKQQIERFHTLFDPAGHPMMDNFRPVQDMNSRVIYTNNKRYGSGKAAGTSAARNRC